MMTTKNFTPLNLNQSPFLQNKKFFFFEQVQLSIFSIVVGLCLVGVVYISRLALKTKTYVSKAADSTICYWTDVENPRDVKAYSDVGGKKTLLNQGDQIESAYITFEWEKDPRIDKYYIALSYLDFKSPEGKIDPAKVGIPVVGNSYTFNDLKPKTQYYLFIRSRQKNGRLAFIFPTPLDCNFRLAAEPIFQFKTK